MLVLQTEKKTFVQLVVIKLAAMIVHMALSYVGIFIAAVVLSQTIVSISQVSLRKNENVLML